MSIPKNTVAAVLAVLAWSGWGGAGAQSPAPASQLEEQHTLQQGIYRSRGENVPEGYTTDRSLLTYTFILPAEFGPSLARLGPRERWLDIGAGQGRAILDYYTPRYDAMNPQWRERRGSKARAVAISIEDRRTQQWHQAAAELEPNKVQYLVDKRLREYSLEELGRFQVITDVLGGFSYAADLSLFMEKVLGFLELNGSFFTVLQDVHLESGKNKPYYEGSPFLTEIANADGSKTKVCAWLKSIACVEVICESREDWKPAIEAYRVRKVCNDVAVPALGPVHFLAGTPPERGFQLGTARKAAAQPSR